MDWTIADVGHANHNPEVVVNGQAGKAPIAIDATVGVPVTLDAAGTRDPDGHALTYRWFFYPEAGTGIPGQPVYVGRRFAGPPDPKVGGPASAPPSHRRARRHRGARDRGPEGRRHGARDPGRRRQRDAVADVVQEGDPDGAVRRTAVTADGSRLTAASRLRAAPYLPRTAVAEA